MPWTLTVNKTERDADRTSLTFTVRDDAGVVIATEVAQFMLDITKEQIDETLRGILQSKREAASPVPSSARHPAHGTVYEA